jgi:PAS domain S-box-containing protein
MKVPSYKNGKKPSVLLYITIIAITLAAIAVTIFLGKKNHRETIRLATEQFNRQQLILARSAAKGIETFIADVDNDLLALSNFPVVQKMQTGILDRMEVLYQGIPPQTSSRRLDKNGILRFIYPNEGWRKDLTGRDYSQEPWFQKAKKTGGVVISGLIINEAGERRIRMVRPVYVEDEKGIREFNGVIKCSINPETIANLYVSPIVSGDTGYAWLLNEQGIFLAHHKEAFVGLDAFKVRAETNPELSYNTIINIQQRMMAGEEGAGSYVSGWHRGEKGKIEKLIAYTSVHVFEKLWSVAICAPVDEVERITGKAYSNELYSEGFIILILTAAGVFSFIAIYRRARILEKEIEIRKQAQERIVHLNAVLQAIRNVNQLIVKVKDRERVVQGACDNLIKTRGYGSAWIALIEEDGRFITAAQAGAGNGFTAMVDGLKRGELTRCMHLAADQSGVLVMADPAVECGDCPLVGIYAGKARLIAPLEHESRIYGFITVMVSVGMAVDEEEQSLFEEVAGDIAFALHSMELEEKRRKAENALRESESQYKHLYSMVRLMSDNLPDLIWTKDLENRFIFANKACCEKLLNARDTDEPIGKTDMYFANREKESHSENPEYHTFGGKCTGSDLVVLETKKPQRSDESGNVKGKFFHLDVYKAPFWDENGNMIGTVGCGRVVTKERQMEEERKHAEEEIRKLSSAVEQSIDGVAISDLEANLTYVNYAFAGAYGFSPEEMVGMKFVDLLKKEELNKYTSGFNKVKELGSWTCEIENIRKDGTSFPTFMSINILKDAEGMPTGVLSVVRDITEQKKLEAQFRQAQKMEAIGTLTGGIAHDFNNLLTVIIGNAQLALMDVIKDESLRKEIEEIKNAGEKAASLTRQLLTFSRKQIIKPEVIDLNKVVNETEKMLKRMIGEDIEFLTVLEPELEKVYADSGQIDQVIMNLAVNARDAMPKGGKLTIETDNADLDMNYFREYGIKGEKPGHYVMLAVSDTGSGMNKETREHIFEPFFTTKKVGKGTGLGLSTVYGIIKQNNGFVWVYSEPGQGSTFKVYLPKIKGDAEPEEKEQSPVDDLSGSETVLIVEDDDGLRKLAQGILRSYGYRILVAENGEDALRVSKEHDGPVHLLLTDVVMPKMGGKKLAESLQPLYPRMKVIYMSGYTDNAIVRHGVLALGLNFLEKPFLPEGLARKVRKALE